MIIQTNKKSLEKTIFFYKLQFFKEFLTTMINKVYNKIYVKVYNRDFNYIFLIISCHCPKK